MGVAQKRDFYRLKELNPYDVEFIKKLAIDPLPKDLQQISISLINQFTLFFRFKKDIKAKGINNQYLDKEIDVVINNLEEAIHGNIETSAIKYLDSILKEDIGFYFADEDCMGFIYYLCVQYMRTNKLKSSMVINLSKYKSIDMHKIWNVLSHIFAINMGWNLYIRKDSFKMVLLKNESSKQFITGDQPVINTYATGNSYQKQIDNLEFYYPVSPELAILITEKDNYKDKTLLLLNDEEVEAYNDHILKNSYEQIYASSKLILEHYNNN